MLYSASRQKKTSNRYFCQRRKATADGAQNVEIGQPGAVVCIFPALSLTWPFGTKAQTMACAAKLH